MAMEMVGVTAERFPNEPHEEQHWQHERVSLAPVLTFWVGVSSAPPHRHHGPRGMPIDNHLALLVCDWCCDVFVCVPSQQMLYLIFSITRAGNLIKFLSHSGQTDSSQGPRSAPSHPPTPHSLPPSPYCLSVCLLQ